MNQKLFLSLGPFFNQLYSEWLSENPARSGQSGQVNHQEPEPKGKGETESVDYRMDFHNELKKYLFANYDFRYNVLTEQAECRPKNKLDKGYRMIDRRLLNTLVIEVRSQGIHCWDKDVERLLRSNFITNFHPFYDYMDSLPEWDGVDRITPLALRVDNSSLWVEGFRRWLLAMAAQWMGVKSRCANTLTPILISAQQGFAKSTFCHLLMPPELKAYYLDKFDLNSKADVEAKLGLFGLINLDEFDRYSSAAMATLKNLVQLKDLTVRKAYASYYRQLERIASFIGTSNQTELLNDPSGSRRFLCVEVKHPIDCSPIDYPQLYAQLKALVNSGERIWMNKEEEKKLQDHNRQFKKLHPEEELFYQVFEVPENDGEGTLYSASEIYQKLHSYNTSAMRGVSVIQLGRTLSGMGLKKEHTRYGNKYRIITKK